MLIEFPKKVMNKFRASISEIILDGTIGKSLGGTYNRISCEFSGEYST